MTLHEKSAGKCERLEILTTNVKPNTHNSTAISVDCLTVVSTSVSHRHVLQTQQLNATGWRLCIAVYGKPAGELWSITCHMRSQSPAIWHRCTCPTLTPDKEAGNQFTYPCVGYIGLLAWFTCPQTVTDPSRNHLIKNRPGVELTTFRS